MSPATWFGTRKRAWIAACLMLAACGTVEQPDLERLYRDFARDADTAPVIVIPGLFGSKLRDRTTGEEIWPGSWYQVLFGDYRGIEVRFDPATLQVRPDDLEAYDIADRVLGRDFYGPLIDTLSHIGGYRRATPGVAATHGERRFYLFPYDWRQDNVEHARALDRLIEAIRRDYGDPQLRVDIIAHSMGGLIARYYLRYGTADVLDGAPQLVTLYGTSRVRKLILLGTPNMGSVASLHAFLTGERVGLNRIAPEVIATLPSAYELFPHPLQSWLADTQGRSLPDDLFDGGTWRRYRWSIFDEQVEERVRERAPGRPVREVAALQRYFDYRLERARRFLWALSTPEPSTPIRYVLFGGDCTRTPARLVLEDDGGRPVARLYPEDVRQRRPGVRYDELMLEPGDGRVTKPSLLARETLDPTAPMSEDSFLPVAYWFFLCERHDLLTTNPTFQDNLLNVLLTRRLPWELQAAPQ